LASRISIQSGFQYSIYDLVTRHFALRNKRRSFCCRIEPWGIDEEQAIVVTGKGDAMANEEQLAILKQGVESWNKWRAENPEVRIDLRKASLSKSNLRGADLHESVLRGADLAEADLTRANLYKANLGEANLHGASLDANLAEAYLFGATLTEANLSSANLYQADLSSADLRAANLSGANLVGAKLIGANFHQADLTAANLVETNLHQADLSEAKLNLIRLQGGYLVQANISGANLTGGFCNAANFTHSDLSGANLRGADLSHATLSGANLTQADLSGEETSLWNIVCDGTNFKGANLSRAKLYGAIISQGSDLSGTETNLSYSDLMGAYLCGSKFNGTNLREANLQKANLSDELGPVDLSSADLGGANLYLTNLTGANLHGANLAGAFLEQANLRGASLAQADLRAANLRGATLVRTVVDGAKLSGSSVYGISVWDLQGEFEEQKDLVITPENISMIRVDNIKVAQFIYLILNNEELRDTINTLTSKSVLILGRFAIPERKAILDALKNKLREYNLLPIVFDFERPDDKDFTETIKTLAGLCYFVIADVTNPKSSPLELQATVPDYQIPFVPIIQKGERPFAMMVDLQKKYNWVLETRTYSSKEALIKALKKGIIEPAMQKHNELRRIKAQKPDSISLDDIGDE